ncbi:MAG: 50S ribosomal protein L11 methyltransferase [Calditrichaeota bacterium]|nr:MAG: 50S ribosomal protein L11 methyltransferase [Calditrichota bacterium]
MKDKEYIELHLPIGGFDTDALSGILYMAGCMGIQELEDAGEWLVYLPGDWTPEHMGQLLSRLQQVNPDFDPESARFEKLPYRDWNAEWKQYFVPIEAAPGIWVRPPWHPLPEEAGGTEVIIDPQMAFGTGHHETTRLMIQAMQTLPMQGATVLDLGTGSGILAILARKLGAGRVLAVDIDPEAIANARHNAALNQVEDIDFVVGDISVAEGRRFSIILANIEFGVLAGLALHFYQLLEPGGNLLLSGLLKEDVSRLSYIYKQAGLYVADKWVMNEWVAVVCGGEMSFY